MITATPPAWEGGVPEKSGGGGVRGFTFPSVSSFACFLSFLEGRRKGSLTIAVGHRMALWEITDRGPDLGQVV